MSDDEREQEIEGRETEAPEMLCGMFSSTGNGIVTKECFQLPALRNDAALLRKRMLVLGAIKEINVGTSRPRFAISAGIVAITDRRKVEIKERH
jgi:hypothetical protein